MISAKTKFHTGQTEFHVSVNTQYHVSNMLEDYLKHLKGLPLYIVGGTIRDRILKRYSHDIDIVVPSGAHEVALDFARKSCGSYVLLDDDPRWKVERVVVKSDEGILLFDFAKMQGGSIEEDLAIRDFTINAVAISLEDYLKGCFDSLIDPLGGLADIHDKRIVVLSDESFKDDPLRMLRAFRFAAELGFEVDPGTRKSIARNRHRLQEVSGERIRDELFKILSRETCISFIVEMDKLGLLEAIFPEILSMKGTSQNGYHHLDVWGHSLLTLENVEAVLQNPEDYFGGYCPNLREYLDFGSVSGRLTKSIIKLTALFHDVGKPETKSVGAGGRVMFPGHEDAGRRIVDAVAGRLRLSRKETGFVRDLVGGHMHLSNLSFMDSLSTKVILRFFRKYPGEFWAYFILFIADSMAARGGEAPLDRAQKTLLMTKEMLDRYYREIKPRVETPPLITGRDLIDKFGLSPGPLLGRILNDLENARLEGDIRDRDEALRYAEKIIGGKLKKEGSCLLR